MQRHALMVHNKLRLYKLSACPKPILVSSECAAHKRRSNYQIKHGTMKRIDANSN